MKKSRLYSLSVLVIGVLISVSLLPLRIYAQSLTSPFLGINMQVTAYGENATSITLPKINIEYIGSTVPSGYISGQLNCTTPSSPSSSTPCDVFQFQNTSGQSGTGNGTRIYLNLQNYLLEANGNATINHQSYFFIDYEFILDDNYKGYVTFTDSDNNTKTVYVNGNQFHYSRMQLSISEVTITIDDYQLNKITNAIQWGFPFESYSINSFLAMRGYEIIDFYGVGYYQYPVFKLKNGDALYQVYASPNNETMKTFRVVFLIDLNMSSLTLINNNFRLTSGTFANYKELNRYRLGSKTYNQVSVDIVGASGNTYMYYQGTNDVEIVGIIGYSTYFRNISDEFAETFGLLDIVENADSASSVKDQFNTESNELITIENTFNDSMNSALENVSPTFNMGQSFLNSANWVSTQFNRLVNNTPFSSLITFGLTLGLGLLIIGKVRK